MTKATAVKLGFTLTAVMLTMFLSILTPKADARALILTAPVAYNDIGDPYDNSTLQFNAFTNTWSSNLDTGVFFKIENTDADISGTTSLLDLKYTDDNDRDGIFLRTFDNNGDEKLSIRQDGYIYQAGRRYIHNIGTNNIFVGSDAGPNFDGGSNNNVVVGYQSGDALVTGSDNTFVGSRTGSSNVSGNENTFVGKDAGLVNVTGQKNVIIGAKAGDANTVGSMNVFVGQSAGTSVTNASENTLIGFEAGRNSTIGEFNTLIGSMAGASLTTGSGNVMIGNHAGENAVVVNNELFIDNSNTSTPLIHGNFAKDQVTINGNLNVTGEITGGSKIFVQCGKQAPLFNDGYLNGTDGSQQSANLGFVMPRAGSVTAIGASFNVAATSGADTVSIQVHDDGASIAACQADFTATGAQSCSATFEAHGASSFAAGSVISCFVDRVTSGAVTLIDQQVGVEISLDN